MEILLIFAGPVQCRGPTYIVTTQYLRGSGAGTGPPPSIVKAVLKAAAAPDQPDHQQQYDGADRRIDDFRNETGADVNAEARKQPTGDEGADNADNDIADDAKAGTAHDLAGQPARHQTDE